MSTFLEFEGFVFDTEALKDAYVMVPPSERMISSGHEEAGLFALVEYFSDWSPTRSDSLQNAPTDAIDELSDDEKRDFYNRLISRLSDHLKKHHSRSVDDQELKGFLNGLGTGQLPDSFLTFLLRYLWSFSERLHLYEQGILSNEVEESSRPFGSAIAELSDAYLDAKEVQYRDETKINHVRFQSLQHIRNKGGIQSAQVTAWADEENQKHEQNILQGYNEFTILGQLYYDYFKPRLNGYLRTITDHLLRELSIDESTAHHVNFVQPRQQLSDTAWFAIYPEESGDKANAYQLFLGIHWDTVQYGIYVGDNIREGGWRDRVDLTTINEFDALTMDGVREKFTEVLQTYYQLNNIRGRNPPVSPPAELASAIERQFVAEKQVILYGPPGTGKTFEAQRFAKWWVFNETEGKFTDDQIESVTFHPSYSYEDFIEGLTAQATDDGSVEYFVQDGIFKRVANNARRAYVQSRDGNAGVDESRADTAPPYVLIIDEINRGNLAQIFGETITLLEATKRGTYEVSLAHSDESFSIPPNLYVIGTMNTADRSIALVDAALRRRFRFIACEPDFGKIVQEYDLPDDPLQDGSVFEALLWLSIVTLDEINDRIVRSADLGKGKQIGHTRLFNLNTVEELRDIWRFDILPLLEEYYFGQFDRIRQELFDGNGDELFDWERKQIRDFSSNELFDALSEFVDEDVSVSVNDGGTGSSSRSRKQWDRDSFFEEIETSYSSDIVDLYQEFFEFGRREADEVGYGSGKYVGALQFYWDEYQDGRFLVYELRTDGGLQFRFWGRSQFDEDDAKELFAPFLEKINPLIDDPIELDFLLSDEFTRLEIPIDQLTDEDSRNQVKQAILEFVDRCGQMTP